MKRSVILGIIPLLIVILFLSACQEQATEPSGVEMPVEEESMVEDTEEQEEETEAAAEEEAMAEEEQVDKPIEEEESKVVYARLNEPIEFQGHSIELIKYYDASFLEIRVDDLKRMFKESRTSEIFHDEVKVTYERSYYSQNGTIKLKLEKFELGENEYLLDKGETADIGNSTVRFEQIKIDDRTKEGNARFSLVNSLDSFIIKEGETKSLNGITVTVIKPYWRSGNYYVHAKIVPA